MKRHARTETPSATRRVVRWLVALFVPACAVAAAAGVLVARRNAASAFDETVERFQSLTNLIPGYPDAHFFPMGESLAVAGLWREMGYAVTLDSPRQVADRYEAIWQSQGYRVERRPQGDGEWVSAGDLDDPWMRGVWAKREGNRTLIIASVRNLWREPETPDVPIPAACVVVSDDAAYDRGVQTHQVFLSCRLHLDDVLDYYDGALHGAARKARLGTDGSGGTASVTYSEAGREVTVTAEESEPAADGSPRTAVSMTWQEQR